LLNRAWQALEEEERRRGTPYHSALRLRADEPELSAAELTVRLGQQCGKPLTEARVRQFVHRAREKFADRLYEDVAHSLQDPSPEQVEEELRELGLLPYCQSAVQHQRGE
jgi:RNA polymerase sigma-70 factor (ECF subfamily)